MNIMVSIGITTIKKKNIRGRVLLLKIIVTADFIKHVKYLVEFVDENCINDIIDDYRLEEAVQEIMKELEL